MWILLILYYIEYKNVEKWDGKLPTFVGGDGTLPILNIGNDAE